MLHLQRYRRTQRRCSKHGRCSKHVRMRQAASAWMPPCFSLLGAGAYAYIALVRSVLSSKQVCGLSADSIDRACLLLVQAFLNAQPRASPSTHPGAVTGNIRLLTIPGLQPKAWDVVNGLMLDASSLKHALTVCLPLTQPSCMALFGVSLAPGALTAPQGSQHTHAEGPKISGAHTVCEAEVGQEWSPAAAEIDVLIDLMHVLRSWGVRVVACQKVIHEKVQHAALQLGMVPLQRLSAQHAASLSSISGALPINSWHSSLGPAGRSSSWKHMLGVVGCIDIRDTGHRRHLILRPILAPGEAAPASCSWASLAPGAHARLMRQHMGAGGCSSRGRVQTLLLGAATEAGCDELRTAAEGALRVLAWTLRSPWVLPGGGAWQAMIAARLRAKACALERRQKHIKAGAYTAMAGALEQAAVSLIPHSAEQTPEVKEGVRSAARSAAKQLASSFSSTCPAVRPSHIPATRETKDEQSLQRPEAACIRERCVEYIGWCHAKAQLAAVAAVEVHVPDLEAAPSSYPSGQHFPTSLPVQGAGTQGSAPLTDPLQEEIDRQQGGWPSDTGRDFRGAPEASRTPSTSKQARGGRPDVDARVQTLANKCRGRIISAHLLDSAPAMMGALASGVDAACMLLRSDLLVAER
ncbi:TCP-1/cpn60 chaperonin family-domain-containing protein [Dunaliella salina]|uniref:TCP-1/cpn60 chaperonin family-domain-containing protein n=1 Tax=Dunaliella salina TaxID=3046 RepID=A0ABQ7GFZ7_DUNSA|nr:TCP-1/cpn60 chaperonin family-domain-containing protein [Dunaliella salina]|eukprot:KAF5833506.1 TCP-1/cpn60 chaperonin family-domain-containing protein [Dunaliella salina]